MLSRVVLVLKHGNTFAPSQFYISLDLLRSHMDVLLISTTLLINKNAQLVQVMQPPVLVTQVLAHGIYPSTACGRRYCIIFNQGLLQFISDAFADIDYLFCMRGIPLIPPSTVAFWLRLLTTSFLALVGPLTYPAWLIHTACPWRRMRGWFSRCNGSTCTFRSLA